ncbi:sentrin-specific protease 8-like [Tachypleus tridentatus]|uniref:sentrin-specific protease 8-like n=1 Tax=Tachypleus tridentatus TaxID=6853 RepID=UPI003FD0B69A
MASEGAIVLSYGDTLLRESDVSLLNDGQWLNDNIIAFWFEYLQNEVYGDHSESVLFISPSVGHLLKAGDPEDAQSILESMCVSKKELIFLPINDCTSAEAMGGSHWSLLVYCSAPWGFQHYDSHTGSVNLLYAERVACIIAPYIGKEYDSNQIVQVLEMECTQQHNSYDCGIHVICNTEAICRKHFLNDPQHISDIVSSEAIFKARQDLRNLIYSLQDKTSV